MESCGASRFGGSRRAIDSLVGRGVAVGCARAEACLAPWGREPGSEGRVVRVLLGRVPVPGPGDLAGSLRSGAASDILRPRDPVRSSGRLRGALRSRFDGGSPKPLDWQRAAQSPARSHRIARPQISEAAPDRNDPARSPARNGTRPAVHDHATSEPGSRPRAQDTPSPRAIPPHTPAHQGIRSPLLILQNATRRRIPITGSRVAIFNSFLLKRSSRAPDATRFYSS